MFHKQTPLSMRDGANPYPKGSAVEILPLAAISASPNNARKHSSLQIRKIAESIRKFGFNCPVLIDRDGNAVAGHGRLEAAKLLGMEVVPTLRLEHLNREQLRAYALADNKTAELAEWDKEILATELQYLADLQVDFDVTDTGFDIGEIDLLIQGSSEEKPTAPETLDLGADNPAVCRPDDLWELGTHRVLCGNSLSMGAYRLLMGKTKAHVVFVDPPYNVPIAGHVSVSGNIKRREFAMASGEMSEDEFTDFLNQACTHLTRFSHSGSLHFICMDWRHIRELMEAALPVYRELKNLCIWVKDSPGMGSLYRSQHELVFVFKNGISPHRNNIQLGRFGRNRSNVWRYAGVNTFGRQTDEGRIAETHPTIKSVQMIADALLDCTARGDVVLDAFLGSGSTLIAAERTGRICRGIEIDPMYVDVAIRRWQQHTGQAAIHVESGKTFDECSAEREASHV